MTLTKAIISMAILLVLSLASSPALATLTCPQYSEVKNANWHWEAPGGWNQDGGLNPTGSEEVDAFRGALYVNGRMYCLYSVEGHYASGHYAKLVHAAPGGPVPTSPVWECESWYRDNCSCYGSYPGYCSFPVGLGSGSSLVGK